MLFSKEIHIFAKRMSYSFDMLKPWHRSNKLLSRRVVAEKVRSYGGTDDFGQNKRRKGQYLPLSLDSRNQGDFIFTDFMGRLIICRGAKGDGDHKIRAFGEFEKLS